MPDGAQPVLDVRGLKTVFRTRGGEVHAVNDVSFALRPGELLGVVGESGSGKSVTMMSLLRLLPEPPAEIRGGQVLLAGRDILKLDAEGLRQVRGAKVGFVFQDPMTSLNPVFTLGDQLMEPLRKHMGMDKTAAANREGFRRRALERPPDLGGTQAGEMANLLEAAAQPGQDLGDEGAREARFDRIFTFCRGAGGGVAEDRARGM